jgi:hypothetical protein
VSSTTPRDSGDLLRVVWGNVAVALGVVAIVLWFVAVREAHFLNMDAYGLVSVLGWPYFAGLLLVATGFIIELFRTPLRSLRLIFLIALLALFIFGTACAVEPVASLTSSWVHAGFIQYIVQHGRPLNGYDARFSWPGGFSMAAVLVAFAGQANAIGFLRWFPLLIELSYLAPLLVIARFSGVSRRAGWLGIALYYSTNWIYQDYFSPQALNYLFFLVVVATVFACWQPRPFDHIGADIGGWMRRVKESRGLLTLSRLEGRDATSTWTSEVTIWVLGLIGLIMMASSMSHQLTPYVLILALSACLLTRRLGRPELILLIIVLAVGWLSLGASNYWVGHLNDIFGSVFQVSSTIGSNVTGRLTGGVSHVLIVETRIILTGGLLLLAGIGFLRRSADSRALEALAGAPFLVLLAQSYGGEGLQRVVLFGLPFTALLAASALLPLQGGAIKALFPSSRFGRFEHVVERTMRVGAFLVVLAFAFATTIVRGGNDAYEAFSKGELAAVNLAYDHARGGQTIESVNGYLPIGQRGVGTVIITSAVGESDLTARQISKSMLHHHANLIILSRSQQQYGVQVSGLPLDWEVTLESTLVNHHYKIIGQWPTATVLQLTR